jgi:IrrE N-terminal-like domain
MDGLLGAFVPEGAGGVLITDQRPVTVQRYTTAHELGHWRLEHGHGLALDGEEHVFGATPLERERLAQVFAASLLMPPPLVLSLLARIGIGEQGPVGPKEAYFVAREAGVSYEASVRQLNNLRVITSAQAAALLQVRPLTVKSELAGGRRPVHGYADVWPVDEAWNDQVLWLRADDEVVVSLPENRSTGYRWMFADEAVEAAPMPEPPPLARPPAPAAGSADVGSFLQAVRAARPGRAPGAALDRVRNHPGAPAGNASGQHALTGGVTVVGDDYVPGRAPMLPPREARGSRLAVAAGEHLPPVAHSTPGRPAAGDQGVAGRETDVLIASTGRRLLGVRFADPGPRTLRLQHRSPYSSAAPVEEYVLHAIVEPRRHGLSIDQLADDPEAAWAGEVRERKLREPAGAIDDPEQS